MSRRGFSLIEVLVAIALLLALMGAVFSFAYDLSRVRGRSLRVADRQRGATLLVERVEADLLTCLVGGGDLGAGVAGDATSLGLLHRGVAASRAGRGPEDAGAFCDLQRTEYRFDATSRVLEARRVAVTGAGGDGAEPSFAPISEALHRVRFRYHDGTTWRDEFDSVEAGRLPRAVEIAVWLEAPLGEAPESEAETDAARPGRDRRTFDADGAFDERAVARRTDRDEHDEPDPDRVRVVAIPDADAPDESGGAGGGAEVAP